MLLENPLSCLEKANNCGDHKTKLNVGSYEVLPTWQSHGLQGLQHVHIKKLNLTILKYLHMQHASEFMHPAMVR